MALALKRQSFKELVKLVGRIELPEQMITVLNSRSYQHILACDAERKWIK
jgi:hypothetical protein